MSNEKEIRLVLDKFAQEHFSRFGGFDNWQQLKEEYQSQDYLECNRVWIERAEILAELGFVAGQKQERERCQKEIDKSLFNPFEELRDKIFKKGE